MPYNESEGINLSGHTAYVGHHDKYPRDMQFRVDTYGGPDDNHHTFLTSEEARALAKALVEHADLADVPTAERETPKVYITFPRGADGNTMSAKDVEDLVVNAYKEAKKKGRL